MDKVHPWFRDKLFHVSYLNYAPEVVSNFNLPDDRKVFLVDSTLRKILITPGCKRLTVKDKVEIANKSEELGFSEIYAGNNVFVDAETFEGCKAIASRSHKSKITVQVRLNTELMGIPYSDNAYMRNCIQRTLEVGADLIELETDVSDQFLSSQGVGREVASKRLEFALDEIAKSKSAVAVGLVDPGRTDFEYIQQVIKKALEYDPQKIVFYDSFGSISPDGWKYFIGKVLKLIGRKIDLMVHIHDVFGNAIAVAAASVTAGVTHIDVASAILTTEMGVPLTPLESTPVVLEAFYGLHTGIRMERIDEYTRLIEEKTGMKRDKHTPIIGDLAWICEYDGRVAAALAGNDFELQSLSPSIIGKRPRLVWGMTTLGGRAIRMKLDQMGLKYTDKDVDKIRDEIRSRLSKLTDYPIWLNENDVERIIRGVLSN